MCQNVPPLELYDDELFNLLPRTWQNAIARMCVRLHKRGDGNLSDEWLVKKLFTDKKRFPEFRAVIIELGYFRDVDGKLFRAGMLAPTITEDHAQETVSEGAIRMRVSRAVEAAIDELRRDLGLASRTETAQAPHKPRTQTASPAKKQIVVNEHSPAQLANVQTGSSLATGSDSESDSDPVLLLTKGESDSESDSDPRSVCAAHGVESVFDVLTADGIEPNLALEAIAKTCNALKGEERPAHAVIKYARKVALNLRTERTAKAKAGQTEWVMPVAVKGGAAQSQARRSVRPPPLTPDQQAAADEALRKMVAMKKAELAPFQASGA